MIVYEKGKPKKSDYRKFKLRTVTGPDDYASMHEVLTRRFTHGMEEQKQLEKDGSPQEIGSFNRFPDIIMMEWWKRSGKYMPSGAFRAGTRHTCVWHGEG